MKPLRPKDLRKQQDERDAEKHEGVGLFAENAADEFAEGAGGCLVGERLFKLFGKKRDSCDMAEFMGEQFVAIVDEPFFLRLERAADDEHREEIRIGAERAAAKEKREGWIDEKSRNPVDLKAIEPFCVFGDFGEKRVRDAVVWRHNDAFRIVFSVFLEGVFQLLAIGLEEAEAFGESLRRFIVAQQEAVGVISRQYIDISTGGLREIVL